MDVISYIQDMTALAAEGNPRGVFFWIAVYFSLMSLYSIIFQVRTRRWPSAKGILLKKEVAEFGVKERMKSEQDYKVSALYKYSVNDVEYIGSKVSTWSVIASHNARFILNSQLKAIERDNDGYIRVYYNPKKPNKCLLIKPSILGLVITLIFALLPMILYIFKYHL